MSTKIEWTDETWNPVTGCTKISPGCENCYAERIATKRLAGHFGYPAKDPFQPGVYHADKINEPLKWKGRRLVFVCSMGDLFHDDVPEWMINKVFDRITSERCGHHIFQILTKRPQRMSDYCWSYRELIEDAPNIWFGVTAESQAMADERIPTLLNTPCRNRFVSIEPMLEEIKMRPFLKWINWVIVGGETGPGARWMSADWLIRIRDDCAEYNVPFFFKQWGGRVKGCCIDGKEHKEFPKAMKGLLLR